MFQVVIVGALPRQIRALLDRLGPEIRVRSIDLHRALRTRTMKADLVVCTRFMSHAHYVHLEQVADAKVNFCAGGIGSWANLIHCEAQLANANLAFKRAC